VFEQKVINPVPYRISDSVLDKLKSDGVPTQSILDMKGIEFDNKKTFRNELLERYDFNNSQLFILFKYAIVDSFYIDTLKLSNDIKAELTAAQFEKIKSLQNRSFSINTSLRRVYSTGIPYGTIQGTDFPKKKLKEEK
jgi:hypothetical protein